MRSRSLFFAALLGLSSSALYEPRARPQPVITPSGRAAEEPRLQRFVGQWRVVASTFGETGNGVGFEATAVAGGRGVVTQWRQGSGTTVYEAHTLMGYDAATAQVRVLEVNTLGVADLHVGQFNEADELVLELHNPDTRQVIQRRVFTWASDTLHMRAGFFAPDGTPTWHSVTLVRR